jgi:hypothetical protein
MKIYERLEVKLHIFLITESDRGKCQLHILAALSLGGKIQWHPLKRRVLLLYKVLESEVMMSILVFVLYTVG